MSYDSITVTRSTPHVGAEIANVDLTRPLTNREVEEIHDAIIANGVVFFRKGVPEIASRSSTCWNIHRDRTRNYWLLPAPYPIPSEPPVLAREADYQAP